MADFNGGILDLGDVAGARFERAKAWTCGVAFKVRETETIPRNLFCKWIGTSTVLIIRIALGAAPQGIELFNNGIGVGETPEVFTLDTWFWFFLSCDGDETASDLHFHAIDEADTFVLDNILATHQGDDADLTAPVQFGRRGAAADPLDGLLNWAIYVDGVITKDEMLAYKRQPIPMALQFQAQFGLQFFLRCRGEGTTEPDWSGNQNNGVLSGTVAVGAEAPTGWWPTAHFVGVAAGSKGWRRRRRR